MKYFYDELLFAVKIMYSYRRYDYIDYIDYVNIIDEIIKRWHI